MNDINGNPKPGLSERVAGLHRFTVPATSPLDALAEIKRRDLRIIRAARGMTPELRERFLADHPLTTGGEAA